MSDILPTIVWPQDAENYLDEANAQHLGLEQQIASSEASPEFKSAWSQYLDGWRTFYEKNHGEVGLFGVTGVMEQTDRYLEQLKGWRKSFAEAGGKLQGPPPPAPAQGTPTPAGAGEDFVSAAKHVGEGIAIGIAVTAVLWAVKKVARFFV